MTINAEIDIAGIIWARAKHLEDQDPDIWRSDVGGALIRRDAYDKPDDPYGWKIVENEAAAKGSNDRFVARAYR